MPRCFALFLPRLTIPFLEQSEFFANLDFQATRYGLVPAGVFHAVGEVAQPCIMIFTPSRCLIRQLAWVSERLDAEPILGKPFRDISSSHLGAR